MRILHAAASKCKTMVSFRLSDALLRRVDFVAANTPDDALASRSAVLIAAVESWLPAHEETVGLHLRKIGAAVPERK